VGEQKTKPTQHSVQALRSAGLSPHMLACRSQVSTIQNPKAKPLNDKSYALADP